MNARLRLETVEGGIYRWAHGEKPFSAAKAVDVSRIVIPVGWLIALMCTGYLQS